MVNQSVLKVVEIIGLLITSSFSFLVSQVFLV